MTNQRKNITQPADWWAAFEKAASERGESLSEWIGDSCAKRLTKEDRKMLIARVKPGRKKNTN